MCGAQETYAPIKLLLFCCFRFFLLLTCVFIGFYSTITSLTDTISLYDLCFCRKHNLADGVSVTAVSKTVPACFISPLYLLLINDDKAIPNKHSIANLLSVGKGKMIKISSMHACR